MLLKFKLTGTALLLLTVVFAQCPPDTTAVTPPQDYWSISYWNDWNGIEVVSWNTREFPYSGTSTINGIAEIVLDQLADIYAFQEIKDTTVFRTQLMALLPNYNFVLGYNGYYTYLALIYRTEVLTVTGIDEIWKDTDYWDDGDDNYYDNAQYYFASRPPLRVDFSWECGDNSFDFSVIDIHFKAKDEGFDRRVIASQLLQTYLQQQMAAGDSNFIVLGDWNDDISDASSYNSFNALLDDEELYFVNLPLAQDASDYYDSYPNYYPSSYLDHVLITAGLFDENLRGEPTTFRLDDYISNYFSLISDHRPVGWRFPLTAGSGSAGGSIVITEFMPNPAVSSDTYGEWFEIYNADTVAIEMSAWQIADNDGELHVIDPAIDYFAIQPGQYWVFGRSADTSLNGDVVPDYVYSGFDLTNTADEIILLDSQGTEIDRVEYDYNFPYASGYSAYLADVTTDNNSVVNWRQSDQQYGAGDYGTPGRSESGSQSVGNESNVPQGLQLYGNYPNPFNPVTTIKFELSDAGTVSLVVYDLQGRVVDRLIDSPMKPGVYSYTWDGGDFPSGLYLYRVTTGTYSVTNKMLLLK